jgi:dynein intermediate chain
MSDRAPLDQLAAKRAKLQELKAAREARQNNASMDLSAATAARPTAAGARPPVVPPAHQRQESVADILNSVAPLLNTPAAAAAPTAAAAAAATPTASPKQKTVSLGRSNAQHTDILPSDAKILYDRDTQTEESRRSKAAAEAAAALAASNGAGSPSSATSASAGTSTNLSHWDQIAEDERDEIIHERDDLRSREVELLHKVRELTANLTSQAEKEEAEKEAALHRDLSRAEAEKIESSEEFHSFLNRSSKIMERLLGFEAGMAGGTKGAGAAGSMMSALGQKFDYLSDYSAPDESDNASRGAGGAEGLLTPSVVFSVESGAASTVNRPITSIAWSQKYPELLCASYAGTGEDERADSWLEPDGSVLVWNLHMAKRPEYHFTCQSAIHTAQFHPAHPKLIVGGCENGQLLIWDMRQNKQTPVNRSSLSHGHTHPVFSMAIQTLNSGLYQIVSCSSDGQVCVWTENNLHKPLYDIQLINMRGSAGGEQSGGAMLGSKEDITTTCQYTTAVPALNHTATRACTDLRREASCSSSEIADPHCCLLCQVSISPVATRTL